MPAILQQVQGNVFPGFDAAYQHFLFFKVDDVAALSLLCRDLAGHLASAGALVDARAASPAVNLAVTFPLLSFVYRDCERFLDEAFRSGMAARTSLLGDTASERWLFGGGRRPVDIVVIVSGDDLAKSDRLVRQLKQVPGLSLVFSQAAERLAAGVEHFGFKDNISQPILSGMPVVQAVRSEGGADEVPLGEFVLGYPTAGIDGSSASGGTVPSVLPPWMANGSYCVIRRLRQDVAQFHEFVAREASQRNLKSIELAAQIIGRYPDGSKARSPGHLPERRVPTNHIEKMNPSAIGPRRGLSVPNPVDTRKHRILRRGMPFGPRSISTFANPIEDGEDRGLMFVCYQSSIVNQFEFVQRRWANEANFPRENGGMDPIIGQALDGEPRLLRIDGESAMLRVMESWVTMTGGDYFFSPSMEGVTELLEKSGNGLSLPLVMGGR